MNVFKRRCRNAPAFCILYLLGVMGQTPSVMLPSGLRKDGSLAPGWTTSRVYPEWSLCQLAGHRSSDLLASGFISSGLFQALEVLGRMIQELFMRPPGYKNNIQLLSTGVSKAFILKKRTGKCVHILLEMRVHHFLADFLMLHRFLPFQTANTRCSFIYVSL